MSNPIFDRIAERLAARGMTERAASIAAGLGPDAIRDIRRSRSRRPTLATLAKLAKFLECSVADLVGDDEDEAVLSQTIWQELVNKKEFKDYRRFSGLFPNRKDTDWHYRLVEILYEIEVLPNIPVYSGVAIQEDGSFVRTFGPVDWIERPGRLASFPTAAAYVVPDDSMSPAFDPGQIVLLEAAQPSEGTDGVFRTAAGHEPRFMIRRLLSVYPDKRMLVRQYNPPKDYELSAEEWGMTAIDAVLRS